MTSMSSRQRRATMINDSDIDSWKTGSDSNELARKRFGHDHRANSDEDVTPTRMKSSISGPEIRYINPAIYTEAIGEESPGENDRDEDPGSKAELFIVILTHR